MSGAEAITAVQLIGACIDIANTIINIGRAAYDAKGLPPKLRNLFETLPAIEDLLESAKESCEKGSVTEHAKERAQPVLTQCKDSLAELRDIFINACPKDGDDRKKRIWNGTKAVFLGRDSRVQKLLVTIQDNLRVLEQQEIYEIGDRLSDLQQVVESLLDDDGSKYTHTGSGSIFANENGNQENYVGGGSHNRQINRPGAYHEASTST